MQHCSTWKKIENLKLYLHLAVVHWQLYFCCTRCFYGIPTSFVFSNLILKFGMQSYNTLWSCCSSKETGGGCQGGSQCISDECNWNLWLTTLPLWGDYFHSILHWNMETWQLLWEDPKKSCAWIAYPLLVGWVLKASVLMLWVKL